ncbi:hypothetical protein ACUADT_001092 [Enterobacter cloacae]
MSVNRYEFEDYGTNEPDGRYVTYEDYSELEARCAALAAELRAVEAIHNEAVFITDDHYEQCPPEVQKIIRSLAVMQIPAYQAFLAEVRAQAKIEGAERVLQIVFAGGSVQAGREYVEQIRKGVQS